MPRRLLTGRARNTQIEFLRFLPVGGVTTIIDFGLLILLTEYFGIHYLISAAIAFTAGQLWSYVMCVNWVFARCSADTHLFRFVKFMTISLIGLLITEAFLWYFTEQAGLHYLLSKVIASSVSFLTLFMVRKKLLFS